MSRRLAREYAIQFLFSMNFNPSDDAENQLEEFLLHKEEHREEDEEVLSKNSKNYAKEIIRGTLQHLDEIDRLIESNTTGWNLDRIAKVDLAILRLAVFEIMYQEDVPDSVAANEAVELAKKYSTQESGSFVNGILGKIIRGKGEKEK